MLLQPCFLSYPFDTPNHPIFSTTTGLQGIGYTGPSHNQSLKQTLPSKDSHPLTTVLVSKPTATATVMWNPISSVSNKSGLQVQTNKLPLMQKLPTKKLSNLLKVQPHPPPQPQHHHLPPSPPTPPQQQQPLPALQSPI